MSTCLDLHLLGGLQIARDGKPVSGFAYVKAQALLAYLAVTARPHSREALASLFWAEVSDIEARRNLRDVLSNLQRLVAPHLVVTRETVAFNAETPHRLDVADFLGKVAAIHGAPLAAPSVQHLGEAVDLYRGDFLEGFYVRDAPAFEDWMLTQREHLRQLAGQALSALATHHRECGEYRAGIERCRRLLLLEPWNEQAHQQVMLQLALSGRRAAALAQYAACRHVLQAELGAEPAVETTALYERIRAGELSELVEGGPTTRQALPAPPLVGRAEEYARLQHAWQSAATGRSQLVVISGEAGIGKTRLSEELVTWVAKQGSDVASAHLHASDRDLVYAPVIAWLRSDALRTSLPLLDDVWLAEIARLLPEILTKRPNLRQLADMGQRQRLFEALAHAVLFSKRPLLLVIDDAQWCDGATLEWLPALLRHHPYARLLILATVRAEDVTASSALTTFLLALRRDGRLIEIELSPLNHDATVTLAHQLTGAELDPTTAAQLYHETEGHPLFVVETIHAGRLERGDQDDSGAPMLPLTVQSVIRERLIQLSSRAQRLAGAAATIGRVFRFDVLAHACGADRDAVIDDLDELLRRRILREHGVQSYDFTHDKLREVAYGEQSAARRREQHRRIAESLEGLVPEEVNDIARHFLLAQDDRRALPYLVAAGDRAARAYSMPEASRHYAKAIELAQTMDDGALARRAYQGLGLARELMNDIPGAVEAYEQMRELGRAHADVPMEVSALNKLAAFVAIRLGHYPEADTYLLEAERLARTGQDQSGLVETLIVRCYVCTASADFERGMQYLDQSLDMGRQLNLPDQVAFSLTHIANTFTFTTRFAEAWPVAQEGRALMEQAADHLHLSQLFTNAIPYHYLHVGDLDEARRTAQQGTEMAARIGNVFWEAVGAWYVGMIAQLRGEYEAAIAAYRRAAEAGRASGAYAMPAIGLAPLAAVYVELGGTLNAPITALIHEAEALLTDPTKVVPGAQAVCSLGYVALTQGDLDQAHAWFQHGLASRTTWRILERPRMLLGAALVALARKDLDGALMLASEARDIVETRTMQHELPTVALTVARIRAARGEHSAALDQFTAAESLALEMGMRPVVWQARAGAARSLEALSRTVEAQATRHGACAMIDQIAALFEDQELRAAFVDNATQQLG